MKLTMKRFWTKLFGLQVGAKVRVVSVFERCGGREIGERFIGKVGVITTIGVCYYEPKIRKFYDERYSKAYVPIKIYDVEFDKKVPAKLGYKSWYFTEHDLELVD